MKTQFYLPTFIILLFLSIDNLIAQTNTFPSTGAAGMGTTTPLLLASFINL